MANPAELLYNLFISWNAGTSAKAARHDSPGLPTHRHAVTYLNQIEELLDVMERDGRRTQSFRNLFPAWVNYVFAYPGDWNHSSSSRISEAALQGLDMLIGYLDDIVLTVDEGKLGLLTDYLDLVKAELDGDSSISPQLRREAVLIIEHIRSCIDNLVVVGDFGFQQALDRLLSVLMRLTVESNTKDRWQNLFNQFVWPFVMGNATAITGGYLQALMP